MAYFWPLILVVASNSVYHICAKSLPESVDPLASLTVTYLIGSIFSGILYFVTNRGGANLLHEYSQMNWAPYLLSRKIPPRRRFRQICKRQFIQPAACIFRSAMLP